MKNRKKIGGLLLALALTVSMIPQTALAEGTTEQASTGYQTEEQTDAAQTEETTDAAQEQGGTDKTTVETSASSEGEGVETENGSVSVSESTDISDYGADFRPGEKANEPGESYPAVSFKTKADDGTEINISAAENTHPVQIDYDGIAIHSVTDSDGNKIILYCMNNELHWPHATTDSPNVPLYSETTFEDFFNANGIKGEAQKTLKTKLENLLYAGYPYNGYGLYQIVDSAPVISEEEFDQLLTPPQYLREDFPNTLGTNTFSYADRTDSSKMELLRNFLIEVGNYFTGGTTPSGLNYQQLMQLPFIRAAYCMAYTYDPVQSYTKAYLTDYLITESQAYDGTRDAIWWVLKNAGLPKNGSNVMDTQLVKNLLGADTRDMILTDQPDASNVSVSGDPTFYYSTDDQKWHTGKLTLTAPAKYNAKFKLALPDGITEESGKTQISAGEGFSLVSSDKPEKTPSITLSATIPWMDSDLKVYVADSKAQASDGKGYQNMIGAVIRQTPVSITASLAVSPTVNFTFTKVWEDGNNQDGKRPVPSTFVSKLHLKADGVEVTGYTPTVKDNGDGTWTVQYKDLPGLPSGKTYSVTEDSIPPYTSDSVTVKNDGDGKLTNHYTPVTVTVSGKKTWNDGNNQDGKRPGSITVRLLANNEEKTHTTVKADADGNWTYSFENLPKYEDGQEITYTVTEDAVAEYSTEIKDYNITNSYTPGETSVTVTKAWEDRNNQDGKRPESVQVQLYADGVEEGTPVTLGEAVNWTHTWEHLAEKKAGKAITYTVRELTEVLGYTSQVTGDAKTGFTVINTHTPETTSVSGKKTWNDGNNQDGKRPESITVRLLANNEEKTHTTVKADADGNWTYSFENLPKYEDGQEITYTVTEDAVAEYSTEIKDYNITNSYTPGETSVTVTKAWEDRNNQDGKRPESVQVQLYADGVEEGTPVTLGEAVNWTHTWEHLAEKKAGKAITYTVRELTEVLGYTSQVTGDAKTGFTVINTYTPETTSFTFTKKWVDDGNKDGTRPGVGSFMQSLSLMDGDGKVNGYTPDVKDNGDNTYTVTYSGLPKYKDGKKISYFVQEKNIAGYVQSSSTVKNGGTLTNTKTNTKVKTALTVRGGDSSPKTGDNSNIYLYGIAGVSALALLLLLLMWKKRRDGKAE